MILHQTQVSHREDCVKLSSRLEWFGISKLLILFSSVVDPCDKSTTYKSDSLKPGIFKDCGIRANEKQYNEKVREESHTLFF